MVDSGITADIGRSLLVGLALDQLRARSRPILAGIGLVTALALAVAVLFDGVVRVGGVIVFLFAAAALGAGLVVRAVVGWLLRRVAPPAAIADHRHAIQDAVDQLALPTGPISALAFAWRLRDGIDAEVANAADVIATLHARLDL